MEVFRSSITLGEFPIGGRLLFRSKKDWRVAVVARKFEDQVTLSVASPSGYNYRIRRSDSTAVCFEGSIPVLAGDVLDSWRSNFSSYDVRW